MRNSPEEYGAYVGWNEDCEERRAEKPHFTQRKVSLDLANIAMLGASKDNLHHMLHDKEVWNHDSSASNWARNKAGLWVEKMNYYVHCKLTDNCPAVPVIAKDILYRVRKDYDPSGDIFDRIDNFLLLVDREAERGCTYGIDRTLAQLSIHAIEMQIPYIRDSFEVKRIQNYNNYVRGYK